MVSSGYLWGPKPIGKSISSGGHPASIEKRAVQGLGRGGITTVAVVVAVAG